MHRSGRRVPPGSSDAVRCTVLLLVARDGRTLFEGAYGLADRERRVPNTPLTQFRVGSMNKMVTAVATLQLVQAGTGAPRRAARHVPPGLPERGGGVEGDAAPPAHPQRRHGRHLRAAVRGEPDRAPHDGGLPPALRHARPAVRAGGAAGVQQLRLHAPRRHHRAGGRTSYDDHVAARVLAPAGMTATGSALEDSLVPGRAVGYMRQRRPARSCRTRRRCPGAARPQGAGTPRWETSRVSPSRFGSADSWIRRTRRCSSPGRSRSARAFQYAYGFIDRAVSGRQFVGHGGGAAGMNGELAFEPNDENIVNRTGATNLMRVSTSTSTLALASATWILAAACGRSAPSGPAETATVSGVVLTAQTLFTYQNAVAYLPPGKAEYRAAIVFLPGLRDPATGNPLDSRRLVSGASGTGCSIWCLPAELEQVKRRSLELAGGNVALVGTTTLLDQSADYDKLLQALSQFGAQSLHPELASIPILFVGHSQGGCTAYGFSRAHAARVAGFVTMKGGCHNPGPAGAAATVPGFFLIGRWMSRTGPRTSRPCSKPAEPPGRPGRCRSTPSVTDRSSTSI